MTTWLRGIVLCSVLALSACIVRPGPGGDPANPSSGGSPSIVVRNNSGSTICFVNFSSTSDSSWGGDQLGSSETIGPGLSRAWNVNAGSYDVRLQDCQHGDLATRRGLAVNGPTEVTLP